MNKTDLVANLYIGFQNGYITKDEYLDMVNLIPQFNPEKMVISNA